MHAPHRGRGWFLAASLGFVLVAAAHLAGHFQAQPTDPAFQAAWRAMESFTLEMGFGTFPSLADTWNALSLGMAVACGGFGILNLLIWRRGPEALLRPSAVVGGATAILLAVSHALPPVGLPLACFVLIALAFLVAAARARPA